MHTYRTNDGRLWVQVEDLSSTATLTALPHATETNHPHRAACAAPFCEQLATVNFRYTQLPGDTHSDTPLCPEHAAQWAGLYASPETEEWLGLRYIPDDNREVLCEHCGHAREDHAFFPTGESAPFCSAPYRPDDQTLIDHSCECEGFVLMPHA